MDQHNDLPPALLKGIVDIYHPEEIRLFGSRATENYKDDSDYDVLVIVADEKARPWQLSDRFAARSNFTHAADIIPCRRSRYEARKNTPGTMAYEAHHFGRCLSVSASPSRGEAETQIMTK